MPGGWLNPAYPWLVCGVYWVVAAGQVAPTKEREKLRSAAPRNALSVLGAMLLLVSVIPLGPLDDRFVPAGTAARAVGWAIAVVGLLLCVWGRRTLGRNWSGHVGIKSDHELIRSGPYARVRHPIYTGLILTFAGTAVYLGQWRSIAGAGMFLVVFWLKARDEETVLQREFAGTYGVYRSATGMLVPALRRHR
jgi:protein-S-isoprenylcysteine O-methyltransferase Ste14